MNNVIRSFKCEKKPHITYDDWKNQNNKRGKPNRFFRGPIGTVCQMESLLAVDELTHLQLQVCLDRNLKSCMALPAEKCVSLHNVYGGL
jgi:hypothetical protein